MNLALSDAQHRLGALLAKVHGLLSFSADADCDAAFETLTPFAVSLSSEKDARMSQDYRSMELGDLLNLKPGSKRSRTDQKDSKDIQKDLSSTSSSSFSSKVEMRKKKKRRKAAKLKEEKKAKQLAKASARNLLRDSTLIMPPEAQPPPVQHAAMLWDVRVYPNVTEILSIRTVPDIMVELMVRPAGQGKNTPVCCHATGQTLMGLDNALESTGKVSQQKKRRLLAKLSQCIVTFAKSHPLEAEFIQLLKTTLWATGLIESLALDQK